MSTEAILERMAKQDEEWRQRHQELLKLHRELVERLDQERRDLDRHAEQRHQEAMAAGEQRHEAVMAKIAAETEALRALFVVMKDEARLSAERSAEHSQALHDIMVALMQLLHKRGKRDGRGPGPGDGKTGAGPAR